MALLITFTLSVLMVFGLLAYWSHKHKKNAEVNKARAANLDKLISTLQSEVDVGRMTLADAELRKGQLEQKLADALQNTGQKINKGLVDLLSALLVVFAVFGAVGTYFWAYGTPTLKDMPQVERIDLKLPDEFGSETRALAQLAGLNLDENPTAYLPNMQLADAHLQAKQYELAEPYLRTALSAQPEDPSASLALGESLFALNSDRVTKEAANLFKDVLKVEPNSPPANFYLGLFEIENENFDQAKMRYESLLSRSVEGDAWVPAVQALLARIDGGNLGRDLAANPQARGPSSSDIQDAANMSSSEREDMILGMVSGLKERLDTDKDDLDGWRRLVRAQQVLGDEGGFIDSARNIARLAPEDEQNNKALVRALIAKNGPRNILTDEINDLFERILSKNPNDVEALFFVGVKKFQQNDVNGAQQNWQQVLTLVPVEHPAHDQMKQEIDRLLKSRP